MYLCSFKVCPKEQSGVVCSHPHFDQRPHFDPCCNWQRIGPRPDQKRPQLTRLDFASVEPGHMSVLVKVKLTAEVVFPNRCTATWVPSRWQLASGHASEQRASHISQQGDAYSHMQATAGSGQPGTLFGSCLKILLLCVFDRLRDDQISL